MNSALPTWLYEYYEFAAPPAVSLIRAFNNDVYQVSAGDQHFVLKHYGVNWRTSDAVRFEIELTHHLAARGLAVARTIPASDHTVLQHLDGRPAVLFEYAAGEKPRPPFSDELYIRFGAAIARMHTLSDDFVTPYQRRELDLTYLVDEPLQVILPLLRDAEKRRSLERIAAEIKSRMAELAAGGLDWGPIHGDATLDNLHVTADGTIVLYDFDSGGCGWRASDLQGWGVNPPDYQSKHRAFIEGYTSVRPLADRDIQASVLLMMAWDMWGAKVVLENHVLKQGQEAVDVYLDDQLSLIKSR